jgi:DNA-binding XRE family transcriptional regulator
VVAKKAPANKKQFTKEMAETILDLGKQGASQKSMYAAIGVSKATAAKWKEENPEFAEVMSLATTYGQSFWEMMLLANIDNKSFNSRVAELALKGQYPDDYGQQRIDLKANVKQEVSIDFVGEIQKLIKELKI